MLQPLLRARRYQCGRKATGARVNRFADLLGNRGHLVESAAEPLTHLFDPITPGQSVHPLSPLGT